MPRSFEKEMPILIGELMPALSLALPAPREEKEHVVNRMDHWLLALGTGAALVFNGPKKYRGNPKARSLSYLFIDQFSCFVTSKILFL
jgi:hypothetical protein